MFELIFPTPHQVLPLFRGLHTYHVGRLPDMFHAYGTDAQLLRHLQNLVDDGAVLFGHDAGWGMVSYVLAIPQRRAESPFHWAKDRLWIEHLYVAPGFRGQGLGRALIRHLERWMPGQGLREWAVSHHMFNDEAACLYEATGAAPAVLVRGKSLEP